MPSHISPSYTSPFSFHRMSEFPALIMNRRLKEIQHINQGQRNKDGSHHVELYNKWHWVQKVQSGNFRLALIDLEYQLKARRTKRSGAPPSETVSIDNHFGQCLLHISGEIFLTCQEIVILRQMISTEDTDAEAILTEIREAEARLNVCADLLGRYSDVLNTQVIDKLDFGQLERSIFLSYHDRKDIEFIEGNEDYRNLVKVQMAVSTHYQAWRLAKV